jgi:long-chain acyl-CoA synthetase
MAANTYHPSNHARTSPHRVAYEVAETSEQVTFAELDQYSNQIAHALRGLGLQRGDGIAFLMENRVGFFEICWAAQRSGLYFTPISTHLKAEEIAYIVGDCEASVFLACATYAREAEQLIEHLGEDTILLSFGGPIPGYQPFEEVLRAVPTTPITDESSGASMLYSSGTTGHPKGIRRALNEDAIDAIPPRLGAMATRYEFDTETVYLSPAPLYHAAPLGYTMATLGFGGKCIIMQRFDAQRALSLLESKRVTHSQWVPTMFIRMLRLDDAIKAAYDLSQHRIAIHAAAPCPIDVKERMIDWWGPIICEYYAGSEGVGSTFINSHDWLTKPGSVGRSVNSELHIVDENGYELGVGDIGTIYFSDAPAFEYHNAPEKTASAFNEHGWGTLGDVGYVDEDGYLFLTDRKANMIISGGVNIYPQEAENTLLAHPSVLDAAVFGVPNEDFGEEVKAVIQLAPGFDANADTADALLTYCRTKLASIKCPRSIDFVSQLPRLPNGKLYKRELKAQYWPS